MARPGTLARMDSRRCQNVSPVPVDDQDGFRERCAELDRLLRDLDRAEARSVGDFGKLCRISALRCKVRSELAAVRAALIS